MQQITTFRCRFLVGPRAGQIEDYARYKDVAPILMGSPCQDAGGSFGVGVANDSDDPPPARSLVKPDGTPVTPPDVTYKCKFSEGPQAGEIQRFAPPITPFRVGGDCSDGGGNVGTGQAS